MAALKTHSTILVTLLISSMTLLSACTAKDRDERWLQGQGENLHALADYDGKSFELTTMAEANFSNNTITAAKNAEIKVADASNETFSLPLVTYKTEAKLLPTIPLRGRPHHKYKIIYKVTDNFLKVLKVGPKRDLDKDELTYAEEIESQVWAVPLVGYPIKGFYRIEKLKNSDNEETNQKMQVHADSRDEATTFKVDFNAIQIFEPVAKNTVFKSSYFQGEWFYSMTIIATPELDQTAIGFGGGYDQNLEPSTRIKFVHAEDIIKAVNVNVDDRLNKADDINLSTVLTIPVSRKDFRAIPLGRSSGLREEVNVQRQWSDRSFVELSFDKSIVPAGAKAELGSSLENTRLVGLEMNEDYFSYTLQDHNSNIRVRYSFLKAKKTNYMPKRHFEEDFKRFGFFTTQKASVRNYEIRRQEDIEKNTFVSRFNPMGTEVKFFFTKTTPQWLRPAAREAIEHWNDAFKKAGSQLNIVLDESKDVDLGDIRYNAINLIESLTESDLFGFGPSLTDPYTGEIISATSNVHVTPIRSALIEEIRNFIRMELGQLSSKYVGVGSSMVRVLNNIKFGKSESGWKLSSDYFTNLPPMKLSLINEQGQLTQVNAEFHRKYKTWNRERDLSITSGNIHTEIRTQCAQDLLPYISDLRNQKKTHNENELAVLESCSRKLVIKKMLGTLVHELGHNFGLRHNFMASNDTKNFWPTDVTQTEVPVRSSSVMEYTAFNEDRLIKPGKYDIAALRYGYADSIELEDGSIKKLDINKTINENISSQKSKFFKFCTDEHVFYEVDPLCARHDSGTTPLEIVSNLIEEYNTSIALLNYRYDNLTTPNMHRLAVYRLTRFFLPIKKIYEKWRLQLAQFAGRDLQYIEGLDRVAYQNLIEKLSRNNPSFEQIRREYEPAAQKAFQFLEMVAFLPNRYCVSQNSAGKIDLSELEVYREQIFFTTNQSTTKCSDSAVQDKVAAEKNGVVIGEIGHFLDALRFNLDPLKATEPFDIIGTRIDRLLAIQVLSQRVPLSLQAKQKGFAPNFLDEPQYRERLLGKLANRVLNGLDGNSLLNSLKQINTAISEQHIEKNYLKFNVEKSLLHDQLMSAIQGLVVPGNARETQNRLAPFAATISADQNLQTKAVVKTQIQPGYFLLALSPQASFTIEVIKKMNGLTQVASARKVDSSTAQKVEALLINALPSEQALQEMTIKDLFAALESLQENSKSDPAISNLIARILAPELNFVGQISQHLGQISEAEQQTILTTPVVKVSQGSFNLNKTNVAARVSEVIRSENQTAGFYETNKTEIDAQRDLLLKIGLELGQQ